MPSTRPPNIHDPQCPPPPVISIQRSLPEILQEIYASRYTGKILTHYHQGRPRIVEWDGQRVFVTG